MNQHMFSRLWKMLAPSKNREAAAGSSPPEKGASGRPTPAGPKTEGVEVRVAEEWLEHLATLATGLWRARRRMIDPATGSPRDEMRRVYRDVEAAWDALTQAGFEVLDHTGQAIDPGSSIRCIAYQPMPDLDREQVIETIKPTVYCLGHWIQMGEVIIGTPITKEGTVAATSPQTDQPQEPASADTPTPAATQAPAAAAIPEPRNPPSADS